jgi:transcriptional regulator with XRE-family HTH domain
MAAKSFSTRLGVRIRALRELKRLTQAELAEAADVTTNYVGVLERGQKVPTLETLVALAKALGVGPGELLGAGEQDAWLDDLVTLGKAVPASRRQLVLDVLRAIATSR